MANYWTHISSTRLSRRRALAAGSATALSAAFLAACGGDDDKASGPAKAKDSSGLLTEPVDTTKEAKRGGILKRWGTGEGSLDPNISVAQVSGYLEFVYSRLITWKPGFLGAGQEDDIVGDVAESWEFSPDRLQITLKLRPNVKFHNLPPVNGRVIDVDDVVFSWKRFADTSPSRGGIANSANPDAPILGVTSPDSRTIVIKVKEPISYALTYFGGREQVNMIPKEAANPSVLDLRNQHLGTGPFYLAKHDQSVLFSFKRHEEFWDKSIGYVDQVDYPTLTEYGAAMSQFRAGNIHQYAVRQDEVIEQKKDVPALNLYSGDVTGSSLRLLFGRRTPALRDERVRQAFQMSYDRETWLETVLNAAKFESIGLPVDKSWFSAFPVLGESFADWRLEPRDPKAFGANANFYQYNIAEAKKLLAAAGFPNGLEVESTYYAVGSGADVNQVAGRQGMNLEAGIRFKNNVINYETEFIPKYRDSLADFEGVAYRGGPIAISVDPVDRMSQCFYSKSGSQFYGFDSNGKGDASGDPYVDQTLVKARGEVDNKKRKDLLHELERYLAKKAYALQGVSGANAFTLAWPAVANYRVWRGAGTSIIRTENTRWWLDETKAPFKRS